MALFLDGRFLVQLLLASLGERFPARRHIQKHLTILWRASAARERTAFFNMAEIFRDLFSCGPLQISKVAAASTIPVTSAVAQAKIRKSFRILVIAAPRVPGHRLCACRNPAGHQIKMEIPPAPCKTPDGRFGSRSGTPASRRPAASFCDRFGGVPLLAVETDGGEDRKARHHGHDRSLPPAQSNSGADQKKAEQRPARIDDPLGLEHGARGPTPARWQFRPRQLAAGECSSYRIKGAYRDKSRGYRTRRVGRRCGGDHGYFL